MAEQRLRLTVDIWADPDVNWNDAGEPVDINTAPSFYSVAELTNDIENLIDSYPLVQRQTDCLFERLDRRSKERLPSDTEEVA